ncbi:hypothetical protein O0L34_g7451 [Tuta absoluta]|nr:hypothetical protein O0L34_g7451 [Tuta absoluta]
MPHEEKSWLSRWWRALVGEVVATALLMILGVGSMMPALGPGEAYPLTHPALGFGLVVTALVVAFGAVSGAHMNPAVTLAAVLYSQIPLLPALAYVMAQNVGAVIGFGTLMLVAPMHGGVCPGATLPAPGVGAPAAMLVEAVLTGTLALALGGVWAAHARDPARPDHSAPIKLGLTIAGLVYAGGKLTGASLNPARSFAPALLLGCWRAHWAYWLGPLLGAAAAAALHRWVLLPPAPAADAAPGHEELPLRGKQEP